MPRISNEQAAARNVSRLVDYASKNLYLQDYDKIYVQNILLDSLKISEPYIGDIGEYEFYQIMDELSDYAVKVGIITANEKINFETKLIGFTMPSPSKVVELFDEAVAEENIESACSLLFKLGENSAYLRRPDLDKNIIWEHENERGNIIITINLSKPEKTPEQVRLAKLATGGYPKCMLCAENLGWAGNAAKPARQTIRTIPFELDNEKWFMQFSPYQYFDQHVIVISEEHRPMCLTEASFRRMCEFIEMFPNYFIGSNAPLPIVGGSILAHDHYQGGKKVLPVFARGNRKSFKVTGYADVNLSIADWYNSIIRVESKNKQQLLEVVNKVKEAWDVYSDESVNIIASEDINGEKVQHNTITPICSFNNDGEYQFNLILRNNRTDKDHPFGIFHPAVELHNIKQEAIGIIEVMGLFILPGRLASEASQIKDLLTGKESLDFKAIANEKHPLSKHLGMISQLVVDNGTNCTEEKAGEAVTNYINKACETILDTTAVFKNTEEGQTAFEKFIDSICK